MFNSKLTAIIFVAALIAVLLGGNDVAHADGGQLRCSERRGAIRLSVFTSPNPLRAGPVDLSVLAQDATSGDVLRQGEVYFELVPLDHQHPPVFARATFAAADNKLFRAAKLHLPTPGQWDIRVECRDAALAEPVFVCFSMNAGPALPNWLAVWPWFTWPAAVVALFVVHRSLVARRPN